MKKIPLGGLSAESFLLEYWQKKPLLIRQAFPDLNAPIAADELAGLACEEGVESRLIIHDQNASTWDIQHGPFDDETFSSLPESHWTLLVQAVDHWVPQAADFIRQFDFIPNWRIDDLMISYANDGGGVGPHYDNYDVFLIQAEGQRRWEVGGIFDQDSPRQPDVPVMLLEQWQSGEPSWILEPGDMLYLPPQVGHNGVAIGDGCMTYSVGFRAPSFAELLTGFSDTISDQLSSEERYADPDLVLQNNPGEITPQALDKIKSIIQQCYEKPELIDSWFGKLVTESKYSNDHAPTGLQCSIDDLIKHKAEGGIVVRSEGSRFAFIKDSELTRLFVDGEVFECGVETSLLAEALCARAEFDLNNLQNVFAGFELISLLIEQGSLYPDFSK